MLNQMLVHHLKKLTDCMHICNLSMFIKEKQKKSNVKNRRALLSSNHPHQKERERGMVVVGILKRGTRPRMKIQHLFLWLGLHWSSTAQLHHLLVDHLGWVRLTKPGLIAELYGSAKLETIYLRKQVKGYYSSISNKDTLSPTPPNLGNH